MLEVSITQNAQPVTSTQVDKLDLWLLVTAHDMGRAAWRHVPYGQLIRDRSRRRSATAPLASDLPNARGTRVIHVGVKSGLSAFERLSLARKAVTEAMAAQPRELPLSCFGLADAARAEALEAVVAAALAHACIMPSYKTDLHKTAPLERIRVLGSALAHRFERTRAEAAGNGLARQLSALPPNELTPAHYRERVEALARAEGWASEFFDIAALKRRKAGAFLAVVQGSADDDAGILHLRYRPPGSVVRPALALVGKGICFDTGGVNVKPNKSMLGMHEDMQGSAVALGTLLALSRLEVDFPIDCWLALAMNQIGPNAYKPNDVVRALDGTTIEVIHTDAEGRMVLADTLTLASRRKPALIIDYATLTGACIYALGKAYSGVFSNRENLDDVLVAAGRASGERVWPFPQDPDYDRALDSSIADIKQCAADGEADHILAARFLRRFVKHDVAWVHIDLGASNNKGGLAHIPTDTTGFGVRYTLNLLLDQKVVERLAS